MVFVMSLMFAAMPLLFVAGCAEIGQDESSASHPPAMTAAPEAPELAPPPASPSPEAVYLTSETTASMNLPFSDAVRVGHLLFLSGQIGNIPGTTDLAPGGIQGEARQTMENIKAVLEANGSSMDRVIKATVMLADIAEWPAFNEVYVTYFSGDKPARSAFAGSGLAFGARCEVEVIATVGE
jgi:reactive intermediate/imine deaminase